MFSKSFKKVMIHPQIGCHNFTTLFFLLFKCYNQGHENAFNKVVNEPINAICLYWHKLCYKSQIKFAFLKIKKKTFSAVVNILTSFMDPIVKLYVEYWMYICE